MKELWEQAAKGDKKSEEEIFSYLRERFTVIAGFSMCDDDARDIAHDACMAVFKGYKTLGSPYQYNSWAQRILKNKIANYFNRKSLEKETLTKKDALEIGNLYSTSIKDHEIILTLEHCLRKLQKQNPRYALALELIQSGYTTDEVCRIMNLSKNNLYVILNRGRKLLRDCIFNGETKE